MAQKKIDLPLSDLANGAIQEKLDYELQKVFNNIHDKNTKAKDKRSITIKLEFKPDDNRQTIAVSSDFTTKLADVEGVSMTVLTGRDLQTGAIEAKELKSKIPGQTYFDDDLVQKTGVGEPVDVIEQEQKRKIINLQENRG
ncbi:replication terminator protein [Rummeliibacillus stabekisii]|uniref:Replication terminator protein n=1 Tax=Rummeliibacillus stabekisii TaxID=241244 RepID=A0A143HBY9_9BACL|nr:replication terminator protein [Rummeliibacillus stabekisii]AMW99234.1 replication terminator protein [Rummeliibacillus stabekisii]